MTDNNTVKTLGKNGCSQSQACKYLLLQVSQKQHTGCSTHAWRLSSAMTISSLYNSIHPPEMADKSSKHRVWPPVWRGNRRVTQIILSAYKKTAANVKLPVPGDPGMFSWGMLQGQHNSQGMQNMMRICQIVWSCQCDRVMKESHT